MVKNQLRRKTQTQFSYLPERGYLIPSLPLQMEERARERRCPARQTSSHSPQVDDTHFTSRAAGQPVRHGQPRRIRFSNQRFTRAAKKRHVAAGIPCRFNNPTTQTIARPSAKPHPTAGSNSAERRRRGIFVATRHNTSQAP
jgi:hypothetical protein